MVYKEKLDYLLSDIQNLETLVKGLQQEETLPVQSLSRTCNLAYSILDRLKTLESEHIQKLNICLVEQQEELNHLSVLLEQYQAMANSYQKKIQVAQQTLKITEEAPSTKESKVEEGNPKEAEETAILAPTAQITEKKTVETFLVEPIQPKTNISLNEVLEKQNLADFRKAFSLNDRFRFRRDLFHGDESLMNQVISDLNQTPSLQEALDYINSRLNWNNKEEAVADFIKLLEKRYI